MGSTVPATMFIICCSWVTGSREKSTPCSTSRPTRSFSFTGPTWKRMELLAALSRSWRSIWLNRLPSAPVP